MNAYKIKRPRQGPSCQAADLNPTVDKGEMANVHTLAVSKTRDWSDP